MAKKTKQESAPAEGGDAKEHKKNWRETYATVEDIKDDLIAMS